MKPAMPYASIVNLQHLDTSVESDGIRRSHPRTIIMAARQAVTGIARETGLLLVVRSKEAYAYSAVFL